MKKLGILLISFLFSSLFFVQPVFAQTPPQQQEYFVKATVVKVVKEGYQNVDGFKTFAQSVQIQILEGKEKGKIVQIERGNDVHLTDSQKVSPGMDVILDIVNQSGSKTQYTISDIYRINYLLYIALAFFLFIISIAGRKGFGAVIGLGISLLVIMGFIIPQILNHQDPLLISLIGCCIILVTTTYLAHGFSKQTTIAVISTLFALLVTCFFAIFSVSLAHLAGLGSEDASLLVLNPGQSINPKGLLLAGILIGTLGALNDITTTQVAAIFALFKQNDKLSFLHLAEQGFLIGREHIVSLVNTLVLAYAGSSLVIFIFFALNPAHLPVWVIINSESISEEVIRTIAGSFGLILAVPITTFLAAWLAVRRNSK